MKTLNYADREVVNAEISKYRGWKIEERDGFYIVRDPEGRLICSTRHLEHHRQHIVDWHDDKNWPVLLKEFADTHVATSLTHTKNEDQVDWMLFSDDSTDINAVDLVSWATSNPAPTPGHAVCIAWLRWQFELRGDIQ